MERLTSRDAIYRDTDEWINPSKIKKEIIELERHKKRLQIYENIFDDAEAIPPQRFAEICNAERDGRCLVLPCKAGDTVFEQSGKAGTVPSIHQNLVGKAPGRWVVTVWYENFYGDAKAAGFDTGTHKYYGIEDFGKTVFLARAEAAEALKGASDERD